MARPRRFGKSLTISTLYEIFKGNQELFQGLWIEQSDYNWQSHPIIRIDFGQESNRSSEELQETLSVFLQEIATQYGISLAEGSYQRQFRPSSSSSNSSNSWVCAPKPKLRPTRGVLMRLLNSIHKYSSLSSN